MSVTHQEQKYPKVLQLKACHPWTSAQREGTQHSQRSSADDRMLLLGKEEDKNEGSIPWQKTNPGLNIVWSQQNHMDRVIQPLLSMTKYHTAYCITLFGSYRSAKSPALAGMGFLCISCSGPCQHLSSGGCRGLLFSSCSTTSRGCLLCVPSVLPVASDAQLLRAAPTSQRCGYTHEQL
ncbi:uncharacterized protein LOC119141117 isoform X3 [Falco rusticolus]|nr:uncharacterized protein LOC119141117 isoform X3 [Falco rusticolus]XP_037228849.1 uncharacterized protein LOC119141117 isoform X3 [Falco rusticolus]XP_037228850.1 uncharacterized protein LOC119141117 isoform X3 [Falco rusticolus]